jgi:hypothetical protein
MSQFEDKTQSVQTANSQLSDGTCGTNAPPLTTSGVVTANIKQSNGTSRSGIVRTAAAYNWDVQASTTPNPTSQELSQMTQQAEHEAMWYLGQTWPVGEEPNNSFDITVFEATNTSFPTLKTKPPPTAMPTTANAYGADSIETFGLPARTFDEYLHTEVAAVAYGSSLSYSFAARRSIMFYQAVAGASPSPLKHASSSLVVTPGTCVQRVDQNTWSTLDFATFEEAQTYFGAPTLTELSNVQATATIRCSYQLVGAVNIVGNDFVFDPTADLMPDPALPSLIPYGVSNVVFNFTLFSGRVNVVVDFHSDELLFCDTAGKFLKMAGNSYDPHVMYQYMADF